MAEHPPSAFRPMGISEYAKIQKEAGSCMPQFKASVVKSSKFRLIIGIPFGIYVGYRYHPRSLKPFLGTSVVASLYTCMTFSAVGMMIATYNCLKVYR